MATSRKSGSPTPNTNIKLSDVGKYLGVSWRVVGRLLKEGKIKTTRDPLDNRRKLVSTKDLDELKRTSMKDG
jgi:DNA-binding MarR family transcriptional regulator